MFRRHREAADRCQEAGGLGQERAVAQRGGLLPGHSVVLTLQVEGCIKVSCHFFRQELI